MSGLRPSHAGRFLPLALAALLVACGGGGSGGGVLGDGTETDRDEPVEVTDPGG